MGFQKVVNQQPAPAVAGDWAGANPRASIPSNAGGFRAYSAGLVLGLFAWFNPDTGVARNASANGGILGFAHREQKALLTTFLQEAGETIPGGYGVDGVAAGDLWADVGAGGCEVGNPIYANNTTGAAQAAAGGGTLTRWVAASRVPVPAVTDADSTIVALTGVLVVPSALISGVLEVGMVLTWGAIPANVTAKIIGTIDATHWQTDYKERAAVAATTITGSQGTLAKISTYVPATS